MKTEHAIDELITREIEVAAKRRQEQKKKQKEQEQRERRAIEARMAKQARRAKDIAGALEAVNKVLGKILTESKALPGQIEAVLSHLVRFSRRIPDNYVELWARVENTTVVVIGVCESSEHVGNKKQYKAEIFRFKNDEHYRSSVRVFPERCGDLPKPTLAALKSLAQEIVLVRAIAKALVEAAED